MTLFFILPVLALVGLALLLFRRNTQLHEFIERYDDLLENAFAPRGLAPVVPLSAKKKSEAMPPTHYDYSTAAEYRQRLHQVISHQKELIGSGKAVFCVSPDLITSESDIQQEAAVILRIFNEECRQCIARATWSNLENMALRIQKTYDAANKRASRISITRAYLYLKIEELRLEFELEEKIYHEREEQRSRRHQIRRQAQGAHTVHPAFNPQLNLRMYRVG